MAEGFTDKGVITQEPSTKLRSVEGPKEKPEVGLNPLVQHNNILTCGKEREAESAGLGGQGKEVEAVPGTTKKIPEEILRPLENTTVVTAMKETTKDGALEPPECTTTETFKREGSKPPEITAAAAVPTRTTQGSSSATRELPSNSGDATDPGSSVYVKQPPMLVRQPSKRDSPKPSAQDIHQEGGRRIPTRDVQILPSLPPLSPPTIERNEHSSYKVTQAIGGRTTDESPLRTPLSMYPAFPPFIGLNQSVGRQQPAHGQLHDRGRG